MQNNAFTVNSTADPGDGICDLAECTLREALNAANATPGTDLISFNIPGAGVHIIRPQSPLPVITAPVLLDGYSQPRARPNTRGMGTNAVLLVELDGSEAGETRGLLFDEGSDGSTIRGVAIHSFAFGGLSILSNGNAVEGCYLGLTADGTTAPGNAGAGVLIRNASDNRIGTDGDGQGDRAERNIISGNAQGGVFLDVLDAPASSTSGNVVAGNYIGLDPSGATALGNGFDGVGIQNASNNRIGTNGDGQSDALERNVISGNELSGLFIVSFGGPAEGNVVAGNYVGTDATGTQALGNGSADVGGDGIYIQDASNNRIGTNGDGQADSAERNVFSGNVFGIRIGQFNALTEGNVVAGNYVGTDPTGTLPLGNFFGIVMQGGANHRIGTNGDGRGDRDERNLVSANVIWGISVLPPIDPAASPALKAEGDDLADVTAPRQEQRRAGRPGLHREALPQPSRRMEAQAFSTMRLPRAPAGPAGGDRLLRLTSSPRPQHAPTLAQRKATGGHVIAGNYIGTDRTGTQALGNGDGVVLASTSNTRIGTNGDSIRDDVEGNLISGNFVSGVAIQRHFNPVTGADGPFSTNNIVAGNLIGTNAAGAGPLGNGSGVVLLDALDNRIGTNGDGTGDAAERNVISGNAFRGIALFGESDNNAVAGNLIGTDITGALPLGNDGSGIAIGGGASDNLIGGTDPGLGNRIAFNGNPDRDEGNAGIWVTPSAGTGNAILGNQIFDNIGPAIDLGETGLTDNDPDDPDEGANRLQNHPVVSEADFTGTHLDITVEVPTHPMNATYPLRVEFFLTDRETPEGRRFLGARTYTQNDFQNGPLKAVSLPLDAVDTQDPFVTATATDTAGNTSEFSDALAVTLPVVVEPFMLGDPSGNASIGFEDIDLIVLHVLGFPLTGRAFTAADVTGDGRVDIIDAVFILFRTFGFSVVFPAEEQHHGALAMSKSGVYIGGVEMAALVAQMQAPVEGYLAWGAPEATASEAYRLPLHLSTGGVVHALQAQVSLTAQQQAALRGVEAPEGTFAQYQVDGGTLTVRLLSPAPLSGEDAFTLVFADLASAPVLSGGTARINLGAEQAIEAAEGELPSANRLLAAYPNPFNPQTVLGFELAEAGPVRLAVYDGLGREVTVLVEEQREAGRHEVIFVASGLPSGVYFYRLEAGGVVQTRRVTLIK